MVISCQNQGWLLWRYGQYTFSCILGSDEMCGKKGKNERTVNGVGASFMGRIRFRFGRCSELGIEGIN